MTFKEMMAWAKYLLTINYPVYAWQLAVQLVTGRMIIEEIGSGLYQSSKFSPKDFDTLTKLKITAIIDLQGGPDVLPKIVKAEDFMFWPIQDVPDLPNLKRLEEVAKWGLAKLTEGKVLLVHCTAGHNRSGLVNGVILNKLGYTGKEASRLIRSKMPGSLANPVFRKYVEGLV